jgi:hypothetical protein
VRRIAEIEAQKGVVTRTLRLNPSTSDVRTLSLVVTEDIVARPVSEFTTAWRCNATFEADPFPDRFKMDLNIRTFADFKTTNDRTLEAIKMHIDAMSAYGALDYVPNKEKLLCFVRNLSVMSTELKALQESMRDPPSQCEDAQVALADVSVRVRDMMADVLSRFTIQMHGDTHGATGGAGAVAGPDDVADPHLLVIGCTPQHYAHLRAWVFAATGVIPQFKLLYKATRDGFSARDYHRACHGKCRLLCVIREKEAGWLFGGFTSLSVAPTGFRKEHIDATAFIFTLTNPNGIPPTKYVAKADDIAVCTYAECVFAMGYKSGVGFDLVLGNKSNKKEGEVLPYDSHMHHI